MASLGRKEEPPFARAAAFRWAAGGERGLVAAMAPAVAVTRPVIKPVMLVNLKVQDTQRRVVTRTMRRNEKLQNLMDCYYDVVCAAGTRGAGRFVFDGKRLKGEQTPEDLGMKSGDQIDFFGDLQGATDDGGDAEEEEVHVTLKLKVQDLQGRTVECTVGWTQELKVLMDAYYESVQDVTYGTGKFVYNGGRLDGKQTPKKLNMGNVDEDEDGIEIDFFVDMTGGGGWAATYCF